MSSYHSRSKAKNTRLPVVPAFIAAWRSEKFVMPSLQTTSYPFQCRSALVSPIFCAEWLSTKVRAGLETPDHKGAVLGFWDTVAQLVIPCLNPDNVACLADKIVAVRCTSMAADTIHRIETAARHRQIALKAAATRRAKLAGKAVRL
jgi:hypothetical protein